MRKRKPFISIVISSNNHIKYLKRCIDSFLHIKNSEIVIVNNHSENEGLLLETEKLVSHYKNAKIVFYQSDYPLSKNKARNLGLDFSNGSWIYFVDDFDYANEKFIKFFNTYKFNHNIHFYRVPIFSQGRHKEKIGMLKSKYYSTNASSFILNEEWIKNWGLRWEDYLSIDDAIPFINSIYNYKNVNYVYLKKIKSIYHNFSYEVSLVKYDKDLIHLKETLDLLMYKKIRHNKQFAIVLLYHFYKLSSKEEKKNVIKITKKWMRKHKILIFDFWFLGPKLWFKTLIFKWLTLF